MIRNSAWLHWLRSCFGHKNKVGAIQNRRQRSTRRIPQSAAVEGLEDRVLLAATSFNAGTLTIDFSTAGEGVNVSNDGTNITVSSTDSVTGDGTTFATNTITRLVVTDSGGSSDQILSISGSANYALANGLNVTGAEQVNLLRAISTDAADLTVVANKQIYATGSLSATDGNILLKANELGTATGLFIGVDLLGASATTTGNGNVTLFGHGGDDPANINAGVRITGLARVSGKSTTVTGIGGASSGAGNIGVYVVDLGTEISSTGGNVLVDGTGGGTVASNFNYGVRVVFGGKITAVGAGTVTINAIGGNAASSGNNNMGLQVSDGGAQVTSSGGTVSINATGTSNSPAVNVGTAASIGTGTNAALNIVADSIALFTGASPASINSGAGTTTMLTKSAGTLINIGGNDVLTGSLALGLTASELNLITASTLVIGNATAGNVTVSAAVAPANVAQLEIVTGTQIIDSNNAGSDITVTRLGLTAATGIGVGNALDTAVSNLEATTATGGIFVNNTGNLSIGGVNSTLKGVRVTGASGGIDLQNTSGNVRITTAGDTVLTPGNVSIKTLTSGSIVTANNNGFTFAAYTGSVNSSGGTLILDAAGDIDLGETGASNSNGDVMSQGNLTLTAGGSITIDDQASVQTVGGNGTTMTLTAGTNISVLHTHSDGSLLGSQNTSVGLISLRTGAGGTFTLDANTGNPGVYGGAGGVRIAADDMVFLDDLLVVNGGGATLTTVSAGREINLGANAGSSLGLASTEIGLVTASSLTIGDSSSGSITLSAAITPNPSTANLVTGASVLSTTSSGSDITVTNLNITAPSGIGSSTNPLRINADQLSTNSAGSNGDQYLREANFVTVRSGSSLSAGAGNITLVGGEFRLSGSITAANVANGGTLAGSGIVNGNLTSTSVISPGGTSGVGTITVNGNLTAASTLEFGLTSTAAVAGLDYDQIVVNGLVDLSGATYTFVTTGLSTVAPQSVVRLILNDGLDAVTPNGDADGTARTLGANSVVQYNNGGSGNDLVLVENSTPTTVYVDDNFTGNMGQVITDADLGTTGNQSAVFGVNAFTTLAAALSAASSSGTIIVNAGTYAETVSVSGTQTLKIGGTDAAQMVTFNSLATVSGTTLNLAGTSSLTFGDGTNAALAGLITGGGNLTKQGAGIVTVSGDNNYSGTTTVNVGTLRVTANNGLGTTAGGTTVASGATLDLRGVNYSTAEAVSLQGGTIANSSGTTTFAGAITMTVASNFTTSSSVLIQSGAILGSFLLNKTGAGTLRLSNTGNSFSSVNIGGGTLQLGADGVIPDTANIINYSAFDLNGFDEAFDSYLGNGSTGNSQVTTATLTLGANNNSDDSLYGGSINGAINLIKTGTGRQLLGSASSTFAGTVTINSGVLAVSISAGLGTQALGSTSGGTIVNAGGTLEFQSVSYALAEPVTMNGGTIRGSGTSSFGGPITLSTSTATFTTDSGVTLTLDGIIDGDQALNKTGVGTLVLTAANTYSGNTTVSAGTLRVTANDGLGTTAGGTTVASGATLDLRAVDYTTTEPVTLQGGTLYNSSGTTTFSGNVTLAATSFISTNATLLDLKGAVSGSFGFFKESTGTLRLSNTGNSFTFLALYNGTLQLGASGVIPDAAEIVNAGNIDLNGFDETVNSINGTGTVGNSQSTMATLTLGAANNSAGSTISGAITGAISLVKIGTGVQYLGSANNSYTGTTTIDGGILGITSSGTKGLGAIGGGTIINASGTLYLGTVAYELAEPVTINGGKLSFQGTSSFSGPITLSTATATITSNLANSTLTLDGVIDGDQGLSNTGLSTLILTAANTYTGPTTITAGTVVVNGSLAAASTVQVNNGGTLKGTGTIQGTLNVASGGSVSPGNSPGVLNSGSVSFVSGSQFVVEVNGTTSGTFDQLNVTGMVSLGGSTLIATGTITTDLGQQIVIINNDEDDAVVGTFNNLPEGTAFLLNGVTFQITYAGGTDGNDVVLTEVVPPNDVSVTVTDDQTTPVPGGTITYTITVTNTGPFPATATSLIDNFSAKITSATWTSTAVNGATGNTVASSGNIAETLNLPAGASVIYTVTANISAAALGSLINTATVSQVGDTDSDNDTATDIDTLDNPVSIVKIYDAAEASTNGKFRVSQAEATTNDTVVSYSIGGTASNGSDYTTLTGSVTIPAGSTSVDIDVTVLNDLSVEAGETVIVTLTGFSLADPGVVLDATPGNLTATVNLTDNDTNVLTISAPSITETNADQAVTFTVTSPNAVEGGFDVVVSASNGTAGSSDYVLVTTTVHINGTAGETQLVSVTIKGDTLVESNETFSVLLGTVSNTGATQIAAITTGASAVGTVTNDDTASYSISDATVTEGGNLSLTVSLSNPVDVDTTVTVTFTDGTTSAGDFTHTPIPVTFLAGNNTAQVILVATSGDSVVEADETLTVGLALTTPLTGGRLGDTTDAGIGRITNDDTANYSISDATVTEGGELSFTVSLSNPVDVDTTVTVTFTDGTTSTGDFTHTAVPVTFLAGTNTAQVILVSTASDNTVEGDETFTAQLALPAPLTGGRFSATTDTAGGTIVNDDFSTLTIDSPTVEEGDSGLTQLVFTVTSSAAVQNGFTVAFTVTGVTADGTDYTVVTVSPLAFTGTAGETQTIIVNVNGDLLGETNETLSVTLGTVTPVAPTLPASIVTGAVATGTILNDDTVSYTITNVTAGEDAGTLVFDLVADHPLDIDVTIDVTFTDGSATGPDYTSTTQHITFLAGQTTKQVTLGVNDDDLVEALETFSVALGTMTPLSGRSVDVSDTGTATITDNDTATFTVDDVTVDEGAGTLVFHLGTDKPLDIDVTITVTFTAGAATGGDTDFTSTTQQITFPAGQTSHDVIVAISDDAIVEATESFTVALGTTTELGGRSVTTSDTANGTITDNDSAVVSIATLNDGFEADSPTQGKFRITQSAVSSTDTIITYTIGGTASSGAGNDYAAVSGIATIPAGQTTVDFDVVVQDDALVESTETVIVTLTGFDENDPDITLDTTPATVNITDNDVPTFTSGATANVVENTPANIVVLNVDADATLIAAGHALSYSLSGPDSALFNIDSVTGEITFVASPDFETPADQGADNVYEITVTVTADTTTAQSASQNLTITVTPVNDITPVFLDSSPSFNTLENSAANTVVGTVSATDGDVPGQGLTYAIISGNESGVFAINSTTGEITVANPVLLDYETLTSVTLIVRVSDNTPTARTADATVEVNIINVNEDPIITIPNSTGTYHLGKLPAFVSPDATFAYTDNPNANYAGTTLTVSIVAGRSSRDQLTIFSKGTNSGQIHTKGKKVYFGAILIGTLEGGKGSKPDLVVTFNSNATHAAVDNLLRRLNFLAKDKVGTNRTVTMQVRNLEGVDSNIATRDIAVVPRVGR